MAEEYDEYGDEEVEDEMEDVHSGGRREASVPNELRGLRACMVCGLIKTFQQFDTEGCENCTFLDLAGRSERVSEFTSHIFEGMIGVQNPAGSWVCKYNNLTQVKPGVYAMEITGDVSDERKQFLEDRGLQLRAKPATA